MNRLLMGAAGAIMAVALIAAALSFHGSSATATTGTTTAVASTTAVRTGTAVASTTAVRTGTAVASTTSVPTGTAQATGTAHATQTAPATQTSVPQTKTPVPTATKTPGTGAGCTPGFWKNHTNTSKYPNAWPPTGLDTDQNLDTVFTIPAEFSALADDSLLTALSYPGGPTDQDAAQLLLHAAVASILNAAHPDINFPESYGDIVDEVNTALASSDRATMLALQGTLDKENNLGCSINGK